MAQSVDIDLLRRVTTECISVYEALSRAQTLTAESQHVVAMAEDLLRQAGLAYLLSNVEVKAKQFINASTAPEEMVSAYVQIQQSYADLKDALYRLAKAYMEAKTWDEAHAVIEGLLKIDPQYRDTVTLLRQSLLNQTKDLFEQGKWGEGRVILKQRPTDKELRLAYLSSFLDEDTSMDGVRALRKEEPQVSKLPSFLRLVSNEDARLAAYEEYVSYPSKPFGSDYNYDFTGELYLAAMKSYKTEMERYDAAQDRQSNAERKFNDSLQDLRAELSSIISESK